MHAATFDKEVASARLVLDVPRELVACGDRYWLPTLHPTCEPELFARYRTLEGPYARFYESDRLIDLLRAADVLVSDTSSVLHEFAMQSKPVVTAAPDSSCWVRRNPPKWTRRLIWA